MLDDTKKDDLFERLVDCWVKSKNPSSQSEMPILLPLIANIFSNLKKMKNRYSYDAAVQQFALSLFILGGRNCYEFLRLNLPGAFPHSSNLESITGQKEMQMIEGELQFQLVGDYLRSNKCQYAFSCEDCTSAISLIPSSVCHRLSRTEYLKRISFRQMISLN